jgi:hypothetical protein
VIKPKPLAELNHLTVPHSWSSAKSPVPMLLVDEPVLLSLADSMDAMRILRKETAQSLP